MLLLPSLTGPCYEMSPFQCTWRPQTTACPYGPECTSTEIGELCTKRAAGYSGDVSLCISILQPLYPLAIIAAKRTTSALKAAELCWEGWGEGPVPCSQAANPSFSLSAGRANKAQFAQELRSRCSSGALNAKGAFRSSSNIMGGIPACLSGK